MSNAISALKGASSAGDVTVQDMGLSGMITLRGDLSSKVFIAAVQDVLGAEVPAQRHLTLSDSPAEGHRVLWMSPDELLCLVPHEAADRLVAELTKALGVEHALAVNVSDARAHISVTGASVRDVLAKVMPVDFSIDVFDINEIRRSRLAQVAAAVWLSDTDQAEVICFRSVAQYVFDVLTEVGKSGRRVSFHAS